MVVVTAAGAQTFQSALPCGSESEDGTPDRKAREFQSALPCGSECSGLQQRLVVEPFQSALPCGSESDARSCSAALSQFQSALPCGSEPGRRRAPRSGGFQSALPCGSESGGAARPGVGVGVSIRAPVRERMMQILQRDQAKLVSIRAPVRERMLEVLLADAEPPAVSIRAPVRERIRGMVSWSMPDEGFNPRSRAGANGGFCGWTCARAGFNPRSRAGANLPIRRAIQRASVSIRAPVRERIVLRHRGGSSHPAFQSALPCGSESLGGHLPDWAA